MAKDHTEQVRSIFVLQLAFVLQSLAVYDRFGRLMYGSENLVKNVLEYIVFEKHLTNFYGVWRMHAKIAPTWAAPRDPVIRTFRKPEIIAPSEAYLEKERKKQQIKEEDLEDESGTSSLQPGSSGGNKLATV